MGRPELANDPRYASHSARGENQAELDALITEWTSKYETEQLDSILNESGVPTGRIYRAPEMLEDPHFKIRESIVRLPHPEFGEIAMQNVAPKLSETPGGIRWIGPDLGQHNADVYEGLLGMSSEDLALLRAEGVI